MTNAKLRKVAPFCEWKECVQDEVSRDFNCHGNILFLKHHEDISVVYIILYSYFVSLKYFILIIKTYFLIIKMYYTVKCLRAGPLYHRLSTMLGTDRHLTNAHIMSELDLVMVAILSV